VMRERHRSGRPVRRSQPKFSTRARSRWRRASARRVRGGR